jgi:primosomal protein N' (replication factor Y)
MSSFARIAVNVPSLAGVFVEGDSELPHHPMMAFDYRVPIELDGRVSPGHLVVVPFANRTVQGIVLALVCQPAVPEVKTIVQIVDPVPALTAVQISLVEWLASRTLAPISAVIGLFLPPGLAQQADMLFEVRGSSDVTAEAETITQVGMRLLGLLNGKGPLRGRQIDRLMPRIDWRKTAQSLLRRGILSATSVLPPAGVRPKFVRTAQLATPPDIARAALADLGSTAATRNRRRKAVEYLLRHPEAVNVSWVYAESGCNLPDLQELAERDLLVLREQEVWRDPLGRAAQNASDAADAAYRVLPTLTTEQRQAWEVIRSALGDAGQGQTHVPFLLQGVTGSGKTELYLRAAIEAVKSGRQVIVLVPEIALTPQTVQRFLVHFPGQVGLIHSRLSDGERYDTWRRARAGALKVVIGPRSALFTPLPHVGLLVVDECHDASYHQAEPPFYDAVTTAQAYAQMCGGLCILGSATPSVVQRHHSDIGQSIRLELRQRVAAGSNLSPLPSLDLPAVTVIDMREELKAGNRSVFSRELKGEMMEVLRRGEQAILYLNRRGTASHVFCRSCGHVIRCPRCESPLTYHTADIEKLMCHRCGYERQIPKRCPECASQEIRSYGLGTEKVEDEIQRVFPKVRTLRWDWETTRQKDAHELILHHFSSGRADILIGTQMLAKGLDLPRVTLVGIVMADVGLFLPDPFAAERVFQLLTQVAGRAGRTEIGGRVILQTFTPEHYAIQAAARHDVNGFHKLEITQRRRLGFPPFTRLLRLEYRHHDPGKAEDSARAIAASLQRRMPNSTAARAAMIGPAPCCFPKLEGKYRWQIILRGADPGAFLKGQRLTDWRIEVDPVSLL